MEEQVIPWLLDRIVDFMKEGEATIQGSTSVVDSGFVVATDGHKATIKAKYDKIEQDRLDKIEAEKQRVIRKAERKKAREIRAKDLELEKFRDGIQRNLIFKGERQEVLKTNLLDIHGFLSKESFLGTLGGLVQQVYYIVDDIVNRFPAGLKTYMEKKVENVDDDYFTRPNNLRELIMSEHFMPFLMTYLKDLKCESIDLFLHPLCAKFLDDLECPHDDLSGLEDEQLLAFKELFLKNKPKNMMKLSKNLDTILSQLIDILAKKIPIENVNVKIDAIHHKVKLVTLPEGQVEEDYEEIIEKEAEDGTKKTETVKVAKNVDFQALVYMKVPQHEVEIEKPEQEDMEMEGKVEPMEMESTI